MIRNVLRAIVIGFLATAAISAIVVAPANAMNGTHGSVGGGGTGK